MHCRTGGAGVGRRIALDIARGLTFLHSNRIAHMDLKSPNGATPAALLHLIDAAYLSAQHPMVPAALDWLEPV